MAEITSLREQKPIIVNGCRRTEGALHLTPGIKTKAYSHNTTGFLKKPKSSLQRSIICVHTSSASGFHLTLRWFPQLGCCEQHCCEPWSANTPETQLSSLSRKHQVIKSCGSSNFNFLKKNRLCHFASLPVAYRGFDFSTAPSVPITLRQTAV